ncbi:MAG: hypothetical protein JWP29_4833 [Rhodoferax sp.]|nr:hypothetical protein [Rhodoferax sp.]
MGTRSKTIGRVKPESEKIVPGRPRKEPPADAAAIITDACAKGASKIGVAMALAVDVRVLDRWLSEQPSLKDAFDRGRERERGTLHDVLFQCAIGKNGKDSLIAAMFLLKARHGYVEGDQGDHGNRVNVTFNIPGAMPLSSFMTVENEPAPTKRVSDQSSGPARRA